MGFDGAAYMVEDGNTGVFRAYVVLASCKDSGWAGNF